MDLRYPVTFERTRRRLARAPLTSDEHYGAIKLELLRREWEDVASDERAITQGAYAISAAIDALGRPSDPWKKEPFSSERSIDQQSDQISVLPGTIAIEADGLLGELSLELAGWEQVNLSVCLIDYAIKHGFHNSSASFNTIRAQAIKKYPEATDKKVAILNALNALLLEHSAPNTYSQSRRLIEKAINVIKNI